MKKIVFILSLVLVLVFTSVTAFAQTTNEIIVAIDSVKVEFNDELGFPFVDENGRTLVPFNIILTTYGADVKWDNDSRTATAEKDGITVGVPIDESYIIVNGEQKAIDTKARIINGRTYLPIRAVIEAFGSDVEWDQNLKTVVITKTPVDAKAIFLEASNKSYDWKNLDMDILMNMSIPTKDDAGSVQTMNMDMKMYMTFFMEPTMRAKINSSYVVNAMGQEITQPVMDMYLAADDTSYTTYMGMNDGTGTFTWVKQTIQNEMLADLFKYDEGTTKKNKELIEKYLKDEDVKYFGKHIDESGRTLLKLQYAMPSELYKDMFSEYIEEMSTSTNEQDVMTVEVLKGFVDGGFGNITSIVYVDEATSEFVKYEMDLGNMIVSMMEGMTGMLGEIPADEMDMLKQIKANMVMEILNVNQAKEFEIPKEALNAPEITDELQQLEDTKSESQATQE